MERHASKTIREWVQQEAIVLGPEFLRVDGVLNHRIDPAFIEQVGEELARHFMLFEATCVLTAEAAGNIVAFELAKRLGIRALYAKKGKAATMENPIVRTVVSPTKGTETQLAVCGNYLDAEDRVIIVDDFLYKGVTSTALAEMVAESGAVLAGFGFVIEKSFANGRQVLSQFDVPIVSLAPIASMDSTSGEILFVEGTR